MNIFMLGLTQYRSSHCLVCGLIVTCSKERTKTVLVVASVKHGFAS
jgi:hypothetical protein